MSAEPPTDDDACLICGADSCSCIAREVLRLLRALPDDQREEIFSRFCAGCREYLAPGDRCNCLRDD